MNNELRQLFANKQVQKEIVEFLISKGYASEDSVHFQNMSLTKLAKTLMKTAIEIDPEFIKEYRAIWPKEKNSTPSTIKAVLIRYLADHPDHTYDQILKAAKRWVYDKKEFCGEAHYFFEKTISTGVKDIRCERYIELILNEKTLIKKDQYDDTRLE